jgi:predicted HTH transcriptional regulator
MTDDELQKCVEFLCSQPSEAEWLEFKQSTADPYLIGENISALSNAAALHRKKRAFMLWGVEDGSRNLLGTAFRFRQTKKGKEELESWLLHMLDPRVEFHIYEGDVRGKYVVLLEI